MNRPLSIGICWVSAVGLAMLSMSSTAEAAGVQHHWHQYWYDFHLVNCWPHPYVEPDRQHVRDAIEAQVASGWRRQNLLGDHYFDENNQALTEAGRLKVQWTLTQVPEHRRMLFVTRGLTPDITQARMAAVEAAATQVLPSGESPSIQDTHLIAEGHPASDVALTTIRFRETKPTPQLPSVTAEEE